MEQRLGPEAEVGGQEHRGMQSTAGSPEACSQRRRARREATARRTRSGDSRDDGRRPFAEQGFDDSSPQDRAHRQPQQGLEA